MTLSSDPTLADVSKSRGIRAAVTLSLQADRSGSWATLALFTIKPLMPIAVIGLLALVVDAATHGRTATAIAAAIAACVLSGVSVLVTRTSLAIDTRMIERTDRHLDMSILDLCTARMGVPEFESPRFLDRIEVIRQDRRHLTEGVDVLGLELGAVTRLLLTMALLQAIDLRLLLLPLVSVLIVALNRRASSIRGSALLAASAPLRRALELCGLFFRPTTAFELKSFGHAPVLLEQIEQDFDQGHTQILRGNLRAFAYASVGWLAFGAAYALSLYWVAMEFTAGATSAGGVVLAILLLTNITQQVDQLVFFSWALLRTGTVGAVYQWLLSAAGTAGSTDQPAGPAVPRSEELGLDVAHLSFRYDGSDTYSLHDVSFRIPAGSVVALVGENGAGKSTLVKTLLGLYPVQEGTVRLHGRALHQVGQPGELSATFQDFARLEFTLRDAVRIGSLAEDPGDEAITQALETVGGASLLADLSDGLDTRLGNSFPQGRELSGGQWQKTALARSLMPRRPLLLALDEPTSAVDPISEAQLITGYFRRAKEIADHTGSVVIVVTHRLNSLEFADHILVLSHGRLIEAGTHTELLAMNGEYSELFELQRSSYV